MRSAWFRCAFWFCSRWRPDLVTSGAGTRENGVFHSCQARARQSVQSNSELRRSFRTRERIVLPHAMSWLRCAFQISGHEHASLSRHLLTVFSLPQLNVGTSTIRPGGTCRATSSTRRRRDASSALSWAVSRRQSQRSASSYKTTVLLASIGMVKGRTPVWFRSERPCQLVYIYKC